MNKKKSKNYKRIYVSDDFIMEMERSKKELEKKLKMQIPLVKFTTILSHPNPLSRQKLLDMIKGKSAT